jgi:hypothetical protein
VIVWGFSHFWPEPPGHPIAGDVIMDIPRHASRHSRESGCGQKCPGKGTSNEVESPKKNPVELQEAQALQSRAER